MAHPNEAGVLQTLIFEGKYIHQTVKELRKRRDNLNDAMEWCSNAEDAAPMEQEARIISRVLEAINMEYAPGYFNE